MATILDYLDWRGDLSFAVSPFGPVDGVILARLVYFPFDGLLQTARPLREAVAALPPLPERRSTEEDYRFLETLIKSPRFSELRLSHFVNRLDAQTQFAAMTIELSPGELFLSFRGTDNTLVGWKEDFNMSFVCPVPAQELALEYVTEVASGETGMLLLGGHSKGGNLAVYSAAFCDRSIQDRIRAVYNYDGPGFDDQVLQSAGYQRVYERAHTFVPQSSIVGMMLGHEEQYSIVSSTQFGIWQHDVYSWQVERTSFVCLEHVTGGSRFVDFTLKEWLRSVEPSQREQFIDAIYEIMSQTNAKTMREMGDNWLINAITISKSIKNLDEDTRKAVVHTLSALLKSTKTGLALAMKKP